MKSSFQIVLLRRNILRPTLDLLEQRSNRLPTSFTRADLGDGKLIQ